MEISKEEALKYHTMGRPGKIEVKSTKPFFTSRDLSLAYTPGVAEPCREIHKNPNDVYKYTSKGNLVAVVSNGSAVLGLGNIGALAGKPVMEGKGVLFKRFADIDVFDIELETQNPDDVIKTVQLLQPTFGGVNLEDIKAPECFYIEEKLKETCEIPVFHDDQHGTAIISAAALLNAAELANKKLEDMRVVVSGAGAAAIACTKLYIHAGVNPENVVMFDSKGCIHNGREDLNKYKKQFATDAYYENIAEALKGADLFLGVSVGGLLTREMIKSMADDPIVFALANPDPEITYPEAIDTRDDIIMATGRSDYPNQVNNVLGFPFIFRGALDVRAKQINEDMKMAAVRALAQLAKEKVPESVLSAYGGQDFKFGRKYIIPKPFDPRVLWKVAPAVAKAAVESGVAQVEITDWDAYEQELKERLGYSAHNIRVMIHKAKKSPKDVVYIEGENEKIIRAAYSVQRNNIGNPVLLGNEKIIHAKLKELGYDVENFKILDPVLSDKREEYARLFYERRKRKGVSFGKALDLMKTSIYFGSMMVAQNDADTLLGGIDKNYPETIRPALQCVGLRDGCKRVSGLHMMIIQRKVYFFADTTININLDAEGLADMAISTADKVKMFDIEPRVAMLSFSNFGSARSSESEKVRIATELVKQKRPDIIVDGEMQAEVALDKNIAREFPFSAIQGDANVLIFPNLSSANIAYKLFERTTDSTVIGPILMGMAKPIHIITRSSSVDDIVNMTAIAVVEAEG